MIKRVTTALIAASLAGGLIAITPAATATQTPSADTATEPLPAGLPPAGKAPEPKLPTPQGWPFRESFPRTSGTHRLDGGALFWSDFIYDDYGAKGLPVQKNPAVLRAPTGTFGYPDAAARNNGADIFRTAVAADESSTYWRIDWNTLVDPNMPIALFAIDRGGVAPASGSAWPAGAGITQAGPDVYLLVSGRGAWLLDGLNRASIADVGGAHTVDKQARSFVVRLPRTARLGGESIGQPSGTWKVQLVSGLANDGGTGFRQLGAEHGALAGQPNVYNVGFRSHRQEDPHNNYWMEVAQANALTSGDISKFAADIVWSELLEKRTTDEPLPRGYSNRWYVSTVELGQGYEAAVATRVPPKYLGRVQPYAVYVPESYDGSEPVPLTWILHSGFSNHNQWAASRLPDNPMPYVQQMCEQRGSICVSSLGRSDYGWWMGEAELDVFEVWNRVWKTYRLDADRVFLTGLSLGGYGTYHFGLMYPDLFAGAVVLAGPPACAIRLVEGADVAAPEDDARQSCAKSGDTGRLVENARWLPYFVTHDTADPLVPFTGAVEQVGRFRDHGYRVTFEHQPIRAHSGYGYEIDYRNLTDFLRGRRATKNPARIDYRWYPNLERDDLGTGPQGAWWVQQVKGRLAARDDTSRIRARSEALAGQEDNVFQRESIAMTTLGLVLLQVQDWDPRATAPTGRTVHLDLENVEAMTLDVPGAGLYPRGDGVVQVSTDGDATLALVGLAPGSPVSRSGVVLARADAAGTATVQLAADEHTLTVG